MQILKRPFFIIIAISIKTLSAQSPDPFANDPVAPKNIPGYRLAWHDEFNVNGRPDTANWIYEKGFMRNEELQWYQPENAACINGSLVITGRQQQVVNPLYKQGSGDWKQNRQYARYTSASLQTSGLHYWKFGRFEIRARIDSSKGCWPAIWTLGASKEWPSNGEIDIMEFYRVADQPNLLSNLAWGTASANIAKWHTEKRKLSLFTDTDPNWVKKFHTWRMDWSKDAVNIYLDDILLNTTPLDKTINADGSNPFLQPHFLLLNLALGGNGGEPDKMKSMFTYEVDYVRVYQKVE